MGKVVVYVENPDKTTNPEFYENGDMPERECQGLDDVIAYAVSSHKTQQVNEELGDLERFVSGINCNPSTAQEEMMAVKKHFGKEDGTISCSPEMRSSLRISGRSFIMRSPRSRSSSPMKWRRS